MLNSPIKLYVGGEDEESPLSLPTNPSSLSTEEIKAALKTKKPSCAGITASYSCGNHDVVPQYSGSIVSVNTGDEIAMNSLIMSVVSIDASGNGSGKIKIPMFNNAEVGVTFSGIKVAEGGCIVEGRAELSGVDLALLNEQQRAKLDQAYSLFLEATDAVYANAGAIAETINTLTELYEKIAQKTKIILDKVNGGKKISKSEQKALVAMKQKAKEGIDKQVAYFTKKFGSEGSDEIIKLVNLASQSCTCEAYTETSEPNKGPYADAGEWIFYDDDCKKCLEEDKQKQEELAKLAKAFEEKLKTIKDKKMECGCGWNSIKLIWQSMGDNGNCEEIIAVMNKFKADLQSSGSADVSLQYLPFDANKPIGQVSVGDICIDNFSIEMQPHDASGVEVFSTKKDQYKDSAVEISGNRITFNDYQAPTDKSLSIKTDNNEQAKLIEKWLFEGAKGEEEVKRGEASKYSPQLLSTLIREEQAVKHVYNDYKGAKSYYCKEHEGHSSFKGDKCKEQSHWGKFKVKGKVTEGYGNPTIGVGHLIVGEDELKKWCDKGNISESDVSDLLEQDLEPRVKQLLESLPKDKKPNQCQFDAMLSIVFNRGIGGFKSSTFYKQYVKKGNFDSKDENEIKKIKDFLINDGSKLAGGQRRKTEAEMYFNCKY